MKITIFALSLLLSATTSAQSNQDKSVDDLFAEMDAQASEAVEAVETRIVAENEKQAGLRADTEASRESIAAENEKQAALEAEREQLRREQKQIALTLENAVTKKQQK